MSNIRSIDWMFLDQLLDAGKGKGYVLDFSDRTFAQFFADELNVDIDNPCYAEIGTSKGNRFRCFLKKVDDSTAVRALKAIWEYREALRQNTDKVRSVENADGRFLELLSRIEGGPSVRSLVAQQPIAAFDRPKLKELKEALVLLSNLAPQARGYAFEDFLKRLFNVYGLAAREPFKLRGEQIDGSFQLANETYLVEAKWQDQATGVSDLHTFHGKIEQKAAWTRGLFVSNSGFTHDGLAAFGRGKRVICMDGLDLFETLNLEIPLNQVLDRKVRRAAETGSPFVRVRDLFPS